jgi:hypothetical protein
MRNETTGMNEDLDAPLIDSADVEAGGSSGRQVNLKYVSFL